MKTGGEPIWQRERRKKCGARPCGLTAALVFVGLWRGGRQPVPMAGRPKGEELSNAALDQSLRSTTLSAMRGTIYDATGKVLAQSASVWTVVLEPAYFADYDDPEGHPAEGGLRAWPPFWRWTRRRSTKRPRAAPTSST